MAPDTNVVQPVQEGSYFVNKLIAAWHARNELLMDFYFNDFKDWKFTAEEAEYFLNYMIKETSVANNLSAELAAFWKIIFDHEVHRKIPKRGTPFIGLLVESGNVEILQLLFDYPLKPNLRHIGPNADTPLHYLCKQNWYGKEELYARCMNWLLENEEVDPHAFNCDFKTPLDLAIDMNNEIAIELLSEVGFLANDKREQLKPLFLNSADYRRDVFPNQLGDLELISFSQIHSCLKIIKPTDQDLKKDLLLDILNLENYLTSTNATATKQKMILLQEACRQDFPAIVNFLLEKEADPSVIDEWNDNHSAISIVEEVGDITILPQLWERDDRENDQKIDDRIWSLRGPGGCTILHTASVKSCPKAMYRILESSGLRLMGVKNDVKEVPFVPDEILETGVLKKFMDSKVIKSKIPKDKWLLVKNSGFSGSSSTWQRRRKICLDLTLLIDFNADKDSDFGIENLMEICKNKIYHQYLIHPIIKILLLYRWESLRWIFFLNLIFCILLTVCLTFNIVWTSATQNDMFPIAWLIQSVLLIFLTIREVTQWYIQGKEYFKPAEYENYFEVSVIVLGGYLTLVNSNSDACQHIGAFVILFTWLQLMLLIGKHPSFAVQIEMFLHVLTNFVKFLFIYSFMIVAFAMTFIVLFKPNTTDEIAATDDVKFATFFESIFRTFVMIGGEFDAADIPFANYPGTSHVIFLLFVFVVVIVLLNMLNGLAVYDTQMIKQDASSYIFLSRLRYLTYLDKFSKFLPKSVIFLRRWIGRCCFPSRETFSYVLNDEDIWRELEQIIYEQQSKSLNLPTSEKIEYDDLSKQMKLQSESIEKLTKLVDELSDRISLIDGV